MTAKRRYSARATRRDLRHLAETFDRGFTRLESRFEGVIALAERIDSKVIALLELMRSWEKSPGG